MDNKIKAYNAWFAKGKEEGKKELLKEIEDIFSSCCKYKKCYPGSNDYTGEMEFNINLFEKKLIKLKKST